MCDHLCESVAILFHGWQVFDFGHTLNPETKVPCGAELITLSPPKMCINKIFPLKSSWSKSRAVRSIQMELLCIQTAQSVREKRRWSSNHFDSLGNISYEPKRQPWLRFISCLPQNTEPSLTKIERMAQSVLFRYDQNKRRPCPLSFCTRYRVTYVFPKLQSWHT